VITDLPDIQNTESNHQIYLENVGITDLQLPIMVMQKDGTFQQTIATMSIFTDLAPEVKGISMSRLLEVMHEYTYKPLNSDVISKITEVIRERCESDKCRLEISFPYFMQKTAPASGKKGYINHTVKFVCENNKGNIKTRYGTSVIVTSLCPCSKEISDGGAHNQKCFIDVEYCTTDWVWIEDVIHAIETCGSSEIYSILKRPDEKVVTERAYNNPLFVEDIIRNVYSTLESFKDISNFKISVASDESIHLHKAVARASKSSKTTIDDNGDKMSILVESYKNNASIVAAVCDGVLDRSGALLGKVREEARVKKLKENK